MALTDMQKVIKQEIEELAREEELSQANNNSLSSEENVSNSYSLPEIVHTLPFKVYFTHFERELILALARPHLKIIECREISAVSKVKKAKVFKEITRQFNNTHGVNPRTEKQIRQCYQNLKKKLRKESTFISPEQEETGAVEIRQENNLPSYHILAQPLPNSGLPVVLMPVTTSCDSDNSSMEISKSQAKNTSTADTAIVPTPSNSSSNGGSELDSSNLNCPDNEEVDDPSQGSESEVPEPSPAKAEAATTPRESSFQEVVMRLKKKIKPKPKNAPSAAMRAAVCIEAEHAQKALFMRREEERREQRAGAEREEQELRMEHLRAKIRLTETKTRIHEKILELMDKNPGCVNINLLKHVLSQD